MFLTRRMNKIFKILLLILTLGAINWPLVPALQNYNEVSNRIVLCCLGLSLLIAYQSALIGSFRSLSNKQVSEQQVGLAFFGMLSGFLLLGMNIFSSARLLAYWLDPAIHIYLKNYYGIYISLLTIILTILNGVTTIILLQRWLELLDKAKLSKASVALVWAILSGSFAVCGTFIFYFLKSGCDSVKTYYVVISANLTFFQLMVLVLMLIYLRRGVSMQPFKLTAIIVILYVVIYSPANTYWLIKGILLLWDPSHKGCFDEHVLEVAFLIMYALTISPVIFGIIAVIFVCVVNRFCSSQEDWDPNTTFDDRPTTHYRFTDPREGVSYSISSSYRKSNVVNM